MQIAEGVTDLPVPNQRGGARPGAGRKPNPDKQPRQREPQHEPFILPKIPRESGAVKPAAMVKWWQELNEDQLAKMSIYVYRTWPITDAKQANPDDDNYIDKLSGTCPFTLDGWQPEMMGMWGSGNYKFYVKEGGVSRHTVYANGLRDLVTYPPQIDYNTLVLSDPANKDFVKWARTRNLIPSEVSGDSNDMAGSAAVESLVNQNERLTDKVLEMVDRATTPAAPSDVSASAQLAGMQMVQQAGERALDVAMKSADRMAELNSKSNDPLTLVKSFTEMAAALGGGNNKGDSMVVELRRGQNTGQRVQHSDMRQETRTERESRRKRIDEDDDDGPRRPKTLMEQLREMKEMKEIAAEVLGGKPSSTEAGEGEDGEATAKKSSGGIGNVLLDAIGRNLPSIAQAAVTITGNLVQAFMLAKNPAAAAALAQNPPAASGNSAPPGTHQTAPTMQQIPSHPIAPFIAQIAPTLLHHMNTDGFDGLSFAGWLIDSGPQPAFPQAGATGRSIYNFLKEQELKDIKGALQTYPPLWESVESTPKQLDAFLAQFLTYDEEQAKDDE